MGTTFDDPAFADKVDSVAFLDRAQTVSNRNGGSSLGGTVKSVLDDTFAVAVQCRGGLVQQQDGWVSQESTSDSDTFWYQLSTESD